MDDGSDLLGITCREEDTAAEGPASTRCIPPRAPADMPRPSAMMARTKPAGDSILSIQSDLHTCVTSQVKRDSVVHLAIFSRICYV